MENLRKIKNVLSSDVKNKRPPGDAFEEHFACGGVPRRLSPGPPATRVCHFGLFAISGGQNQDLFPVYSRALGPFAIKI